MATVYRRYAKEFKEVKATLESKGYNVKLYGDDGYSMRTDEFGIDSVRADESVKNRPETRFSVWMKDNGRILVNVGIATALYNTFVYGGLSSDERKSVLNRKSDNENKERSIVFTDYNVFKKVIDMVQDVNGVSPIQIDVEDVVEDESATYITYTQGNVPKATKDIEDATKDIEDVTDESVSA